MFLQTPMCRVCESAKGLITHNNQGLSGNVVSVFNLYLIDCLFTAARLHARRPLSVHAFRALVKRWADAAGYRDVSRFGRHSTRRSKATRIYRETRDIEAVKHLLGRTGLGVTKRYLSVSQERALEVSRQLSVEHVRYWNFILAFKRVRTHLALSPRGRATRVNLTGALTFRGNPHTPLTTPGGLNTRWDCAAGENRKNWTHLAAGSPSVPSMTGQNPRYRPGTAPRGTVAPNPLSHRASQRTRVVWKSHNNGGRKSH